MGARITAVSNQKGGVAKTTTTHSLAIALKNKGYKVLVVDLDSQCNLTGNVGADPSLAGIRDIFNGDPDVHDIIQKTEQCDILSSSPNLFKADQEFVQMGREFMLRDALNIVRDDYDYIILDTPPTLGIMTINALIASNDVLIPLSADRFALQGLDLLFKTIQDIRKFYNPDLRICGLLLTKYKNNQLVDRQISASLIEQSQYIDTKVFKTHIRESVSLRCAQLECVDIFTYAPHSTTANDYLSLMEEYING